MDYFSKPFSICLLRNHILKDPIIDWFNINESLNKKYKRDTNTFYKDFILISNKFHNARSFIERVRSSCETRP